MFEDVLNIYEHLIEKKHNYGLSEYEEQELQETEDYLNRHL